MRTIKTIQDIRSLQKARVFPEQFSKFLEDQFLELKEAFDFDGADMAFTLDLHGFMVVLEKGDNLRDLSIVGLNRLNGGLLGSLPEFIEKVEYDQELWYKIVVIYTNEYGMAFYLPEVAITDDEEIQTWLEAHVE
ncbi:hypothetical protein ACTID9_26390 [Brevibacillus fluminis]|uniref:hypothetical protein n=1 Tax=Brevibacillus fluminis TaxID=511487 RepID=UPI003F8C52A4